MPDYKESAIAGRKWQRCFRIDLQNNSGQTPNAIFYEEERFTINAESIGKPVGHIQVALNTPTKTFQLLNPADDTVIGQAQHQDVYVLLYSLYRALADERDNPPHEQPAEEPV